MTENFYSTPSYYAIVSSLLLNLQPNVKGYKMQFVEYQTPTNNLFFIVPCVYNCWVLQEKIFLLSVTTLLRQKKHNFYIK